MTGGAGAYTNGQSVTVTATPGGCYDFLKWTKRGSVAALSTNLSYQFTITNTVALVANFVLKTDAIVTLCNPAEGGTATGGGVKSCGAKVTVRATAAAGFKFLGWSVSGTTVSTLPVYSFTNEGAETLTANFQNTKPPTLTVISPASVKMTTTNSTLNVIGKAKDNVAVTGVYFSVSNSYSVSGSEWYPAQNEGGWTNWTFTTNLALGTNVIKICARDSVFLDSTTNTLTVVREYMPDIATFPVDTTNDVTEPLIQCAFDGSNYMVVYHIHPLGQFAQFVSPSGQLVGGPVALNGHGDPPAVAFDGTNYLTAWDTYMGGPLGDASINGTFVSRDGAVGIPGQLIQSTNVDDFSSMVFGGGVYFLTWVDSGGNTSNQYIKGAMISPSGEEVVSDFVISQAGYQTEIGQAATAFDGTNFMTTWSGTQGGSSINGQIISPAGNFVTDPFVIYTNSADVSKQIICVLFDGTKYLVLFSPLTSTQSPATWHIQGRFVTTTGQVMAKEINLTKDSGPQAVPRGAFDGTNYLLTWSQGFDPFSTDSSDDSVKAGLFDVNGNPVSSEFTLFAPQGDRGAMWAPVLFDGTRFFSVAVLGKMAQPMPNIGLTNGIISSAFIAP
jgi:hypothetical protein